MIFLSGCTNNKIEDRLIAAKIGLMVQPNSGYAKRVPRYPTWAADNTAFSNYVGDERWLDWLARLPTERCLFAAVPDIARRPDGSLGGDPVATWEKFLELGPVVQSMGFPAALVAQNGMEAMPNLREQLEACDCLFLGGDTKWKLGQQAEWLAGQARALGKWVHMGRANSRRRLERARSMGCNSVDGTFIGFGPEKNLPRVRRWLVWLDANQQLPFVRWETPSLPVHKEAAS